MSLTGVGSSRSMHESELVRGVTGGAGVIREEAG